MTRSVDKVRIGGRPELVGVDGIALPSGKVSIGEIMSSELMPILLDKNRNLVSPVCSFLKYRALNPDDEVVAISVINKNGLPTWDEYFEAA